LEVRATRDRDVIDVRIRISRRFVLAVFLVAGVVVPWILMTTGGGEGGLKIGPVQTLPSK
jgi:hypothetical protein